MDADLYAAHFCVYYMETSVLNYSCMSRVYLESCRRLAEFALVFVSLKLLSRGG